MVPGPGVQERVSKGQQLAKDVGDDVPMSVALRADEKLGEFFAFCRMLTNDSRLLIIK